MLRAHKIELKPNQTQAHYFARACGTARFAWNWALDQWCQQFAAGSTPTEGALRKLLNSIKRQQFPWMLEVSKFVPACAIIDLGKAFVRYFTGKARHPRFKKKGAHDSFFAADPDNFTCEGNRIRLPIIGWVRMTQALRFKGRLISATVSRTADRWFVSILVDIPHIPPARENQTVVGVDLGISALATCSDGASFDNPRPLRFALRRLKRCCRRLARKQKGSQNRRKAIQKLRRLHNRIGNIRKDALHKATVSIVRRSGVIVLEDLNIRGMLANHRLARAISDVGLYEFRRQIHYKAEWHGSTVLIAPRFFPSSKLCNACGHKLDELPLGVRRWECPYCQTVHERDQNASCNLRDWSTGRLRELNACGDRSSTLGTVTQCAAGR
jgi:putative transposase